MEYQQINNGESGLSVRTKLNTMLQGIIEDTTGLPGKMVRISDFTTGNVPQITANGMLEDSGKKVSDFVLTENVVDSLTETYDNYPLSAKQGNILNQNKVDKVAGKGLSDRNFTEAEKIKLANIAIEANKYILPEAGASLGGVKSGGDVTISAGLISVNDDSHNHIISNVDGLQTALGNRELLSNKVPSTSTLSGASTDSEYPSAKLMYNLLGSGGGLQTLTNLVTAFQGTPDNTHYPSEKLVADSLALKISTALKGMPNGVAELDADGFLVASQLPGSVPTPRILEGIGDSYPSVTSADEGKHFWHTGYKGFYIVDAEGAWVSSLGMFSWEDTLWVLRADSTYWRYVEPSFDLIQVSISPLVLGELSTTAYRGDKGKIAYDFSQSLIDNLTTDDATKPLSAKQGKLLQDNKMSKVSGAVAGRIPLLLSTGELEDSGKSFSDILLAVTDEIVQGGIYDVSSHNDGAVFESLSTLLGSANLSTLIPTSVRRGGMSIRFIQDSVPSSDNNYVQYRLMSDTFSTSESDWQGVDDEPAAGSDNLVKSGGIYKNLSSKIETKSINIIDYSKCSLNKGLGVFGEVVDNIIGYTISDYIPVKQGDEIIASVWDTSSESWSPYAVYDKNFNYLRSIRSNSNPSHYVYQDGDAYIRCMFASTNRLYIYGNYGSILLPYQKYNPIKEYFNELNQSNVETLNSHTTLINAIGINTGYLLNEDSKGQPHKTINAQGYELLEGGCFKVKFTNEDATSSDATLNINQKGAKPLYYNGKPANAFNTWKAGEVVEIFYDGTNYYARSIEDKTTEIKKINTSIRGNFNADFAGVGTMDDIHIPAGNAVVKITNLHATYASYFTVYFYDKDGNEAGAAINWTYISAQQTLTANKAFSADVVKIVVDKNNNGVPATIDVVSDGAIIPVLDDVKSRVENVEDLTDVENTDVESMERLYPYNYVISQNGDIVLQANEINPIYKIRVTPFTKYRLDDVRPIVYGSGSYYMYAWYSSYEVIGASTLISGELKTAPFDLHLYKTITPPAGAMALVISAYGSSNKVRKEQDTANSMAELCFKRNLVDKSFGIPLNNLINGKRKIYGTAYSLRYYGISPSVNGVSPYENILTLSNKGWCYFGPFDPDTDEIIHITFRVKGVTVTQGEDISIWVAKNYASSGATQRRLGIIDHSGDYHIYLDPTYYRMYYGYSDTFYIWIYKHDYNIEACRIENFMIYALTDSQKFNNIDGVTTEELFKSTDEGLGLLNKAVDKKTYLIAPNGNKYDYGVDNNGNIIALPVVPNKAAFFGNSLMFGNTYFGMDASNKDSDFYARVNAYIKTLNPNYVVNRYSSVPFETIAELANVDSVVAATVNNLTGDEDLIVLQAGDNTTDAQASTIMPTSCMKLLATIKAKCPNARICWPAIWYATTTKMNNVRNACNRYGAVVATIGELNIPENRGTIGSVIDYGEGHSVESTLNDVISVVENSSTNITITFTYGGNTYTQTIDVNSYTLNGTTLVFTGRYGICTVGAGHPGNRGMKAIANKILYSMGICDDENAYPLD